MDAMPRKPLTEQTRHNRTCKHEPDIMKDYDGWCAWQDAAHWTLCPWGYCSIQVCQYCNRINGGMGPLLCPCDHVRGWGRKYVESMGQQPVALKPKGRHRDRIRNRQREFRRAMIRLDELDARFAEMI